MLDINKDVVITAEAPANSSGVLQAFAIAANRTPMAGA